MKHKKGTDEEANSFDDQLDTPDEVEDYSDEEVESTDEEEDTSDKDYELDIELKKKSNSKCSKAKSDRSKFKIISYREVWENTYWKRKSPFYFFSDEESGDAGTKRNHLVEIQVDDHDLLVNSDNENDDMLVYESEKYSDAEDAAGTNHLDRKLVKRGINRLYKFHMEYGKPGGIKIKQYFDVHLTVKKLVMHHLGQLLRNFKMKMKNPAWYNVVERKGKQRQRISRDDEIRSVGDKLKEADKKIKEGTLNLDDGTNALTVVFGKEKGGYERGVGSGVTYKSHLMNQLAAQGVQLNLSSQLPVASDVTPMVINNIDSNTYEVDGTQSSVVVRDKDARI
nr:hypothetical protein [Tanacetum cinerariifolium]